MLKHLLWEDYIEDKWYWIRGSTLLKLVYDVANAFSPKYPVYGNGSFALPWRLDGSVGTWIGLSKNLPFHSEKYFIICGRYVKKHSGGYYMSDEGVLPYGESPYGRKAGPTYPQYQEHFIERMRSREARRSKHKYDISWSQAKAYKLCQVLKAKVDYRHKSGDTLGQALPVLAATMFLAEPARNPRAFPINLMLLDLIGAPVAYGKTQNKYYTWDKVLWHPEVASYSSGQVSKRQLGSLSKEGGIREISKIGQLHWTGGKLPYAMTGSGVRAVAEDIDPGKWYTQKKELSILIRWLCVVNYRLRPVREDKDVSDLQEIKYQKVEIQKKHPDSAETEEEFRKLVLSYIKKLVQWRCKDFD
jgi:hypothetical protein